MSPLLVRASFYFIHHMKKIHLLQLFTISTCSLIITSCAIIRGYKADGASGPTSYSFEHHVHDTIANGPTAFSFPYASQQAEWTDTQGVLIIQNDSVIYEKCVGDITTDRLATVFSVSKSITSLLCGIAVDEGYIKSIDDPITDYLPELKKKDKMWQKLTIRHLLDMRSGLAFDDTYSLRLKDLKRLNAMAKLNYGKNIMKQIRGLKFENEPGTEHKYESMTTQILGVVIQRATGQSYTNYLSEKVWKPLQMESPAIVNIDSRKHHVAHAFGGISTTMKDLAKIGRLYLNKGVWNGKRIVSEEWIRQSTDYNTDNDGYHFNWYNTSWMTEKPEYPGFYAHGIRAQVLYVNPYKNLIMVRFGKRDDTYAFIPYMFELLSNRKEF